MLLANFETVPADPMGLMQDDLRWRVAHRVASGPHFARSPLLSRFLLFVVSETVEGRQATITEHKIGVAVFGRPVSYRTDDDNIVRNYARQLRKRLAEHFAEEGKGSPIRIEIPVGGYVPSFPEMNLAPRIEDLATLDKTSDQLTRASSLANTHPRRPSLFRRLAWPLATLFLILAGFAAWFIDGSLQARFTGTDPARALWRTEMPENGTTYIVPTDAGFNLMEDMAHRSLSLADYIKGQYADMPPAAVDLHTRQDLGTQPYTDFVSLQVVSMLARQPEYDPRRVLLRFPRDLRVDDLKKSNAVIIGSADSNPWASLVDANTNFRIIPQPEMNGAAIVNTHPTAGEQQTYRSHWGEPAHETFALILLEPNLSGTGHLLLIEGLDIAGTQAAAELLFSPEGMAPIIERALRKDGSLRPFEILVRTTSIQSNAAGTQIVASRIH
jgi:hypothetical protein